MPVRNVLGRGAPPDPARPLNWRTCSGMVTAELAVVMFAVVIVLAMILAAVGVALSEVRVHEAARAAARSAARGDKPPQIRSAARRSAPGASVAISRNGTRVAVDVGVRVSPPFPMLRSIGMTVRAHSVADQEPS